MKNKSVKKIIGSVLITFSVGLNILLLTDNKESNQILENENVIIGYTDLDNGNYSLIITDKTPGSFLELPADTEWNTTIEISNIQMFVEE